MRRSQSFKCCAIVDQGTKHVNLITLRPGTGTRNGVRIRTLRLQNAFDHRRALCRYSASSSRILVNGRWESTFKLFVWGGVGAPMPGTSLLLRKIVPHADARLSSACELLPQTLHCDSCMAGGAVASVSCSSISAQARCMQQNAHVDTKQNQDPLSVKNRHNDSDGVYECTVFVTSVPENRT